jgi:hypothetical protein
MNVAFRPPFPHNDPVPHNCPRLISTDLIARRHQDGDVGNESTLVETNRAQRAFLKMSFLPTPDRFTTEK